MMNNTEADVRTDTLIRVMALFFVAIIVLAVTTNPIPSGTGVGERAPPPLKARPTTAVLGSILTWKAISPPTGRRAMRKASGCWLSSWTRTARFVSAPPVKWVQNANYFMKLDKDADGTPAWKGPVVNFVASATELDIPGHETSRDEIEAFRDKSGEEQCASRLLCKPRRCRSPIHLHR